MVTRRRTSTSLLVVALSLSTLIGLAAAAPGRDEARRLIPAPVVGEAVLSILSPAARDVSSSGAATPRVTGSDQSTGRAAERCVGLHVATGCRPHRSSDRSGGRRPRHAPGDPQVPRGGEPVRVRGLLPPRPQRRRGAQPLRPDGQRHEGRRLRQDGNAPRHAVRPGQPVVERGLCEQRGRPHRPVRRPCQPLAAQPVRVPESHVLRHLDEPRPTGHLPPLHVQRRDVSRTTSRSACGPMRTTWARTSTPTRPTHSTGPGCSPDSHGQVREVRRRDQLPACPRTSTGPRPRPPGARASSTPSRTTRSTAGSTGWRCSPPRGLRPPRQQHVHAGGHPAHRALYLHGVRVLQLRLRATTRDTAADRRRQRMADAPVPLPELR